MASRRAKAGATQRRQSSLQDQQARRGVRKSERISQLQAASKNSKIERTISCLPAEEESPPLSRRSQKRPREAGPVDDGLIEPSHKRHRSLNTSHLFEQKVDQETISGDNSAQNHINHWSKEQKWPAEFFHMDPLHARKKPPTVRRKRSESSVTTATQSDQKQQEEKSAPYRNSSYITLLEIEGNSYMREHELGIRDEDESLCQTCLDRKQPIPEDTIFHDKIFRASFNRLVGKNEARIFKDVTPLIVPFAEHLALHGAEHLENILESVNESWSNCIFVTKPRPQPDYGLGFGRHAFSDDQLDKLQPYVGDISDLSYFRATHYMYFPFLAVEVKCGAMGLDIADRQNAHSMTVAMNGVVKLFKRVGREQELHRRILGFSYSHDDESTRIWAHYPVVSRSKTTFWRHSVTKYYFTRLAERWAAYTFTRNIYDLWVKLHFKLICLAIDDLSLEPDITLQPTESEDTGLSQQFAGQELDPEMDSQLHLVDLQQVTPDTSIQPEKPAPRKRKKI